MNLGIQLQAPQGYKALVRGRTYHFIHSDVRGDRVFLVTFGKSSRYGQVLVIMRRTDFENGLSLGREASPLPHGIVVAPDQAALPPWLDGIDLPEATAAATRKTKATSPFAQANRRLAKIQPLIDQIERLLGERDPILAINRAIKKLAGKVQNETRVRQWVFAYLCFKRDVRALLTEHFALGRWPRAEKSGEKLGRPSPRLGKGHGFNADKEVRENIKKGYDRYAGLGVPMTKIYEKSMIDPQCFGCGTKTDERGKCYFEHPDGKANPTLGQFWYHASVLVGAEFVGPETALSTSARKLRKIGRREIEKTRYGSQRQRATKFESLGPFSGSVSHCLERLMADGYYTKDHPRGLIEGNALKKLCVVRSRDVLTGFLPGIGFGFKGETKAAYNAMKFCMAIKKVRFCALFGLTIQPEDWPGDGLGPDDLVDRGAGVTTDADLTEEDEAHIHSIAGSYQPMTKSPIEASNPREDEIKGAPSYFASALTPVEMVKREILRLIADNKSGDATSRMTPELYAAGILPTPLNLWNAMNDRLRTVAVPMAFDDAVRRFLTKVSLTLKPDGAYFHGMRYDGEALRATEVFKQVSTSQAVKLTGYILELCVRHVWVEVEGTVVEIDAQLPICDDSGQLYISIRELEELEKQALAAEADLRENRRAVGAEARAKLTAATGKDWDAGRRVPGRAKPRSAGASLETGDLLPFTSKGGTK